MTPQLSDIIKINLDEYREMCGMVGLALNQAIEYCNENGTRPTLLIPSRGAIPIFVASSILAGNNSQLSSARFFPESAASVITDNRIKFSKEEGDMDIILYPFTADVQRDTPDSENEARRIRASCTRAFAQLIGASETGALDLSWNQFLTKTILKPTSSFDPGNVIEDLTKIKRDTNRGFIILDTVISGRASSHITSAANSLGIKVIPVLATDTYEKGKPKIQKKYKTIIEDSSDPVYRYSKGRESIFIEGPLISEDRGANFLCAVSIFLRGFDAEGFFNRANQNFSQDFRPSSGIWTFPPDEKSYYLQNYHTFLSIVLGESDQSELEGVLLDENVRGKYALKDLTLLTAQGRIPPETIVNETSSHILAVDLPLKNKQELVRQFAQEI